MPPIPSVKASASQEKTLAIFNQHCIITQQLVYADELLYLTTERLANKVWLYPGIITIKMTLNYVKRPSMLPAHRAHSSFLNDMFHSRDKLLNCICTFSTVYIHACMDTKNAEIRQLPTMFTKTYFSELHGCTTGKFVPRLPLLEIGRAKTKFCLTYVTNHHSPFLQ